MTDRHQKRILDRLSDGVVKSGQNREDVGQNHAPDKQKDKEYILQIRRCAGHIVCQDDIENQENAEEKENSPLKQGLPFTVPSALIT